ncbi:MAG: response regulator [Anaerolineae bacterium]|nr:response regulator [Anaerolineae bacterium]
MPKILVVDDEPDIAELLQTVLEEEGYQVILAGNGREGLAQVAAARPDLILCDVMMPLMDGVSLCRAVQAQSDARDIPLVFMSAGRKPISQDGCRYAAFISKPFELTTVIEVIASLISSPHRG